MRQGELARGTEIRVLGMQDIAFRIAGLWSAATDSSRRIRLIRAMRVQQLKSDDER